MTSLRIDGMTCASCADHVHDALKSVPGVRTVSVSYPDRSAAVVAEAGTSSSTLIAAVKSACYRAMIADASVSRPIELPGKAGQWFGGGA